MYEQFRDIGRDIYLGGLISSHGGNMSVRRGDRVTITRRGSMLGRLSESDLVDTDITPCSDDEHCSRELVVHRSIYQASGATAIVHAHPVHTIYRSFVADTVLPIDSESRYVLGDAVEVFSPEESIASAEAGFLLAGAFARGAKVAVLRGHGPFAIGATLAEAFYHITCLEASCAILDLRDSTGLPLAGVKDVR